MVKKTNKPAQKAPEAKMVVKDPERFVPSIKTSILMELSGDTANAVKNQQKGTIIALSTKLLSIRDQTGWVFDSVDIFRYFQLFDYDISPLIGNLLDIRAKIESII